MSKFYAVANGRQTGIFLTWAETESLVKGYPAAKYKSFKTRLEAEQYLQSFSSSPISAPSATSPLDNSSIATTETAPIGIIYTDGSYRHHLGGYAFLVLYLNLAKAEYEGIYQENGKVMEPATNQRAELTAILQAVKYIVKNFSNTNITDVSNVENSALWEIRTDSMYSIKCLTEWAANWVRNGWKTSGGQDVENQDLIKEILTVYNQLVANRITLMFRHVRAHQGEVYNEYVDKLADVGRLLTS